MIKRLLSLFLSVLNNYNPKKPKDFINTLRFPECFNENEKN